MQRHEYKIFYDLMSHSTETEQETLLRVYGFLEIVQMFEETAFQAVVVERDWWKKIQIKLAERYHAQIERSQKPRPRRKPRRGVIIKPL